MNDYPSNLFEAIAQNIIAKQQGKKPVAAIRKDDDFLSREAFEIAKDRFEKTASLIEK